MNSERIARGFTLLELLVVISIIGLLASIVMSSVSTARAKGKDAAIKSQMRAMLAQAELFKEAHNNSYSGGAGYVGNDNFGQCAAMTNSMFSTALPDGVGSMMNAVSVNANGAPAGSRAYCSAFPESWAFAAPLQKPSASKTGWCVDSDGSAKEVSITFTSTGAPLMSGGAARCP